MLIVKFIVSTVTCTNDVDNDIYFAHSDGNYRGSDVNCFNSDVNCVDS